MDLNRRALIGGAGAIAGLCKATTSRAADPSPKLPIAAFAEKAPMQGLILSPDGNRVLARIQVKGAEMLGTYALDTHQFLNFALPEGSDINWYRWAGSDRFIVSLGKQLKTRSMTLELDGYLRRIYTFDLKTQTPGYIGPKDWSVPTGDDVVFIDPHGEYVLLSVQRAVFEWPSVVRYDLATGASSLVQSSTPGVYQFFCDDKGVVRAQLGAFDDHWFLLYRTDGKSRFERIASGDSTMYRNGPFDDLAFVSGSDLGYALSDKETGRIAAYAYDFGKRAQGELVFASPTNDVDGLAFDRGANTLIGVRYTDDRPRTYWADPLFHDLQAGIDRAMPERFNEIRSWSEDRGRVLIYSGASNDRGCYYLFQLSNSKMTALLDLTHTLDRADMAEMKSVRYHARDGLEIPAFLSLPAHRALRALPLVIMPHGGPYGVRDALGFDPIVQFLSNRGYAVLQPNYRGSDGYGADYGARGDGEWGRKMQDDLDDGLDWLVREGIVDPKRACLVGASYGGYAAAWGATRNPERYRCAACFAGVFDLKDQLGYSSDFLSSRRERQYRQKVKGKASFNLDSVSPRNLAERLQVPILLMHGEEDNVVPVSQSRSYDAGLTRHGKPHEFYTIAKEVHGFTQKESLAFYLTKLDAFLAAHNPA